MKKLLQKILLGMLFFAFPMQIFACAIPPDILHEFKIDSSGQKIKYSLLIWENLNSLIQENLENNSGKKLNHENLGEILEKNILQNSNFSLNNKELNLKFLTGTLDYKQQNQSIDPGIPGTFLTAEFEIDQKINFSQKNNIRLEYNKESQIEVSPLIHPYILLDFQEGTAKYYVVNEYNQTFDVFEKGDEDFVVKNFLEENYYQNNFELTFEKLNDNYKNPNQKTQINNIGKPTINNNTDINNNIFDTKKFLEKYFSKNLSTELQIIGIFIAIVAGMLHGLLPGHSKAILSTFVISGSTGRKKEIFTLIASSAFSHTIFIFVLATVILALQKGTGATAIFAKNITAIIYILFGLFFIWQAKNLFKKRKNQTINRIILQNHDKNCGCEIHKNIFKKTFWTGVIAGANPCIDALVLFMFAISIGNINYAIILILAFSIGIGLILGIIAFLLSKGKIFLDKKSENFAEKFNILFTFIAGIFIILSGIFYLI